MKKSFDFYFLLVFTGAFLFGVSWLIYCGASALKIEKLLGVIREKYQVNIDKTKEVGVDFSVFERLIVATS